MAGVARVQARRLLERVVGLHAEVQLHAHHPEEEVDTRILRVQLTRVGEVAERALEVARLLGDASQVQQERDARRADRGRRFERVPGGVETAGGLVGGSEPCQALGGGQPARTHSLQQSHADVVAAMDGERRQDGQDVRFGEVGPLHQRVGGTVRLRPAPGAGFAGQAQGQHLGAASLVLGQAGKALQGGRELPRLLQQDRALVERFRLRGVVGEHALVGGQRLAHGVRHTRGVLLVETAEVQVRVRVARGRAERLAEARLRRRVVSVLRLDHAEEVLENRMRREAAQGGGERGARATPVATLEEGLGAGQRLVQRGGLGLRAKAEGQHDRAQEEGPGGHGKQRTFCPILAFDPRMGAWRALLLLVVFLPAARLASTQDPATPEATFQQGVAALKAGRLEEAAAAFRRVLQQGGKEPYVHNNLAIVYQQQGRHREAIAECREAIRLDPAYPAPRVVLGGSLLALGRVAEATTALEAAVKMLPKERLAREQLARAYDRAGRPSAAIEQHRAVRALAPDDPEAAYQLGRAYLRLSEWAMQRLRDVDPGSARIYQVLGHNYRVQGRLDLAVRAFELRGPGRPPASGDPPGARPDPLRAEELDGGPRGDRRASWPSSRRARGRSRSGRVSRPRRSSDGGRGDGHAGREPRRGGGHGRAARAAGQRRRETVRVARPRRRPARRRPPAAHRGGPARRAPTAAPSPCCSRSTSAAPDPPELLRLLGGVLFVTGEYLDSAIALKKAEALAPLDAREPLHAGHVLRRDAPAPMGAPRAAGAGRHRPEEPALPVLARAARLRRGALCPRRRRASTACSPSIPPT